MQVVVVVSAMKGVTDRLLFVAQPIAAQKRQRARDGAKAILRQHLDVLCDLSLEADEHDRVAYDLSSLGRDLLHEVSAQKISASTETAAELLDGLASFGELFSARLFAAALERSGVAGVPVSSSEFVTLGRNSSDFSGAIVAYAVDADELVIWTDVDGIYTSNPHESSEGKLLHDLSYEDAHALVSSGAKVVHPQVLPLAAETEMTVWVRNTFKPQERGTRIGPVPVGAQHPCSPASKESA